MRTTERRRARATAPVRVADAGGWTDTWFAGHGAVCNVAVGPAVAVEVEVSGQPSSDDGPSSGGGPSSDGGPSGIGDGWVVELDVRDFGDSYRFHLDAPPARHPLLEAALARALRLAADGAPGRQPFIGPGTLRARIEASVPPGSSLGTSAAVTVALLSAATAALAPERATAPQELARQAHLVETEDLGDQSGIQDQVAAAHGGALLVEMGAYPLADARPLRLTEATWDALADRLVTVYLGRPHRSSAVHEAVIERLVGSTAGQVQARLEPLRAAARASAAALEAGDLAAYGRALVANTAAQAGLDERLIGADARAVIDRAGRVGVDGWKVNGAGGDGGSVTVLAGGGGRAALVAALAGLGPRFTVLDLRPQRSGVAVTVG
ncbi:MAG: GHMP kinase [Acidimicrobiia bacterium]|nr:GHMP kinase [Acidimicrobiia bacterium]